jgi:hypothetical protein
VLQALPRPTGEAWPPDFGQAQTWWGALWGEYVEIVEVPGGYEIRAGASEEE